MLIVKCWGRGEPRLKRGKDSGSTNQYGGAASTTIRTHWHRMVIPAGLEELWSPSHDVSLSSNLT